MSKKVGVLLFILIFAFMIFRVYLCNQNNEETWARGIGSFSGKASEDGKPVPAVILTLSNKYDSYTCLSNLGGEFEFPEVIEGKYEFTGFRPGYRFDKITIKTNPDEAISDYVLEATFTLPISKPISKGVVRVLGRDLQTNFDGDDIYSSFFIKGVGYSPVPIGSWGDLIYPEQVYNRDMPHLSYMNCNTIRTWGKVNELLLDEANRYQIKVIAGFWVSTTADFFNSSERLLIMKEFEDYVSTYQDHPAILMWSIGNEQNYVNGDNWAWYSLVEDLSIVAYEIEGERYHPVATPNGDRYRIGSADYLARDIDLPYLDIWGMNLYKSDREGFNETFTICLSLSSKPIWISEYGIDAYDNRIHREYQVEQAIFARNRVLEMANSQVCIGGTLMAYSDEWWKAGNPDKHDLGGYPTEAHPDGFSNEEWWGIFHVSKGSTIDILGKRTIYDTLRCIFGRM